MSSSDQAPKEVDGRVNVQPVPLSMRPPMMETNRFDVFILHFIQFSKELVFSHGWSIPIRGSPLRNYVNFFVKDSTINYFLVLQ